MSITTNSTEDEVYTYLQSRLPSITSTYPRETFDGIDGEVFTGLSQDTIEMIFPNISPKDKGLLLARVEGIKFGTLSQAGSRVGTPRAMTPQPLGKTSAALNWTTSLPPATIHIPQAAAAAAAAASFLENSDEDVSLREVTPPLIPAPPTRSVPVAPLSPKKAIPASEILRHDEGRFNSEYRRSFSPPRNRPSTAAAASSSELPRLLIELWRYSKTDGRDEFLAESWLPNLKEMELRNETFRLALRRSIQTRPGAGASVAGKVIASRKWFAALILTGRYHRVDNRLELFVTEVKEIELIGWDSDVYYLKIFSFIGEGNLNLVYTSNQLGMSCHGRNSVEFDEQITMRFGTARAGEIFEPIHPLVGATNGTVNIGISRNIGGRSSRPGLTSKPVVIPNKILNETNGLSSIDVLRSVMLRRSSDVGGPYQLPPIYDRIMSINDIIALVGRGDLYMLDPRYSRFESALLPTHEMSALTGTEFTLRTTAQIDALKSDSEYMRNHSQLVELMLASWGYPEPGADLSGAWQGHSWLLRHVLLSCILLENIEESRRVVKVAKELSLLRQIDLNETGYGEALFTLEGDKDSALNFWESSPQNSGRSRIKSPYLPQDRSPLSHLINFVLKGGISL